MRGDTCIERWMKPAIRTEGPKLMTTLIKDDIGCSGKVISNLGSSKKQLAPS